MNENFTFSTRRVQRNTNGYVVQLPAQWCRNAGVGKGTVVTPQMTPEGNLLLIPGDQSEK